MKSPFDKAEKSPDKAGPFSAGSELLLLIRFFLNLLAAFARLLGLLTGGLAAATLLLLPILLLIALLLLVRHVQKPFLRSTRNNALDVASRRVDRKFISPAPGRLIV